MNTAAVDLACRAIGRIVLRIGVDLGACDLEGGHIIDVGRIGSLALPTGHQKPMKLACILKTAQRRRRAAIDECTNDSVDAASQLFEGLG